MTSGAAELRAEQDRLRSERRAFVTATVVRAEPPTSARPGDSALVLKDGEMVGFVGGECARASVKLQALATLDTGVPVLLKISPTESAPAPRPADRASGVVTVHNPCLSGGELEIFLEPTLPPPLLVVHGDAPIARAIRELATVLGYDARDGKAGGEATAGDPSLAGAVAVVVATHGELEPQAIRAALDAGVGYVGLIASPRRGSAVLDALDLPPEQREQVRTPAGLDIGARTPGEVALSILSEIVAQRPRPAGATGAPDSSRAPGEEGEEPAGSPIATDPVCAMSVAAVSSSRHIDHEGTRYYFCGSGCEDAFAASPGAFARR